MAMTKEFQVYVGWNDLWLTTPTVYLKTNNKFVYFLGAVHLEWDRNAQSVWNPPYPVGFSFSGPIRCQNTFWNQWRTTRNGVWLFPPSLFLAHNCLKMVTGRKWRSWLKWSKFDVYQLSHHIPPRQCPESLRQPPATSQTPYKHPKIWHILTNQRQLGEKEAAISFDSIQFIYVVTVLLNIFTEQHLNDW